MALATALSVALVGVEGHLVEVEADLAAGVPQLTVIGLPDAALNEARDRIRAAIVNSEHAWPQRRITLALSPATLPKRGSGFDLAMAAALLAGAGAAPVDALRGRVLLGELGLDGRVRPVTGVLPAVLAAASARVPRAVVPAANAAEAALVPGIVVEPVGTLRGLVALLRGEPERPREVERATEEARPARASASPPVAPPDLADVLGQPEGRRALEVAAAGGHHLFLLGNPGAGKTMLARRLPGLLPPLDRSAALDVTAVHSIAGVLPAGAPLITQPPFQSPHHNATVAALVGGGSGLARPGVASLAHRGVLFLDEAPEFSARVLDALRQPLESGQVEVARSGGTARYPARFLLVLAANQCPCATAASRELDCTCTATMKRRYLGRLSGPLRDRVDLHLRLHPLAKADFLDSGHRAEPSAVVAERVRRARDKAAARLADTPWRLNADIPGSELRHRWAPPPAARRRAMEALDRGWLSARGLDRVLRVAWTLADLAGLEGPGVAEVDGALGFKRGYAA